MRILADTHTLLWAVTASDRLSRRGRELLTDPGNQVWFSTVSLWEIAIKLGLGRLELAADWRGLIDTGRQRLHARWLFVEPDHCHEVATLPWHHRDPFDRMLVAQAIAEGMTLLSRDRRMSRYAADVLW
ncbi:MAG: type II toxin-antitoxin system VapC family toxin [Gemmatimonadota bacterium]|nr:type II toxin-antitoxin system VapC family toxin [Gemmatimonadota bacterium]MDE2870831.1 type II toxin-antitoxin system VapC family toxin [Gemmatimonadota bacterium]